MESLLLSAAAWLDAVGIAGWARGSALVYPIANTLHLLGLVMLVGGIGVVDLRIAGLWRALPIAPLSRALTPVAIAGLAVMTASGIVLFAADGRALATSDIFFRKLVLIALALVNAVAFRLIWGDRVAGWSGEVPTAARLMAVVSLLLWLAAGTMGRWIAYG
ncbi:MULTISPECIES: DUF6644 family protein [unclassified Sphingomonas]|uniref:DUF6644 family protein n=1 Tax=unclassified Sphingomonas TaxID=196159 RepID=UPI002150A4F4|nr:MULTISPECIES: DUF6644 family protein [unclassified Sphingomonas]MCR5871591.1 hypothetical protein [Sphingomonas sp. J344]UUY00114.1 hypothetical protein LRS08_02990 [Sphingomonas sp. J315]